MTTPIGSSLGSIITSTISTTETATLTNALAMDQSPNPLSGSDPESDELLPEIDVGPLLQKDIELFAAEKWLVSLAARSSRPDQLDYYDFLRAGVPNNGEAIESFAFAVSRILGKIDQYMTLFPKDGSIRKEAEHELEKVETAYAEYQKRKIDSYELYHEIQGVDMDPRVNVASIMEEKRYPNEADMYIKDLAVQNAPGDPICDGKDFLPIIDETKKAEVLYAINDYDKVYERKEADFSEVVEAQRKFFKAVDDLSLPEKYRPHSAGGINGERIFSISGGANVLAGFGYSRTTIQGRNGNNWLMPTPGFQLESDFKFKFFPDKRGVITFTGLFPNLKLLPELGVYRDGEQVMTVKSSFQLSLDAMFVQEIPVNATSMLEAGLGVGIEAGRFEAKPINGSYRDTCGTNVSFSKFVDETGKAVDAVKNSATCSLGHSLALYYSPLLTAKIGIVTYENFTTGVLLHISHPKDDNEFMPEWLLDTFLYFGFRGN